MPYYIFLKSLRSLEEFRKNPHVKILPKSPSTNFQSLGKFINSIFNSEILFPCFRPGQPCGPLGLRPSRLPLASPLPQAEAHRMAQAAQPARAVGVITEVVFSFGSRLSFLTPSLYPPADMWGPLVGSVFPTVPVNLGRDFSAPPLCASDAAEPLQPPSSLSPLNPPSNRALTGLNGLNHHSPPP
jgi:hypothetical protein